MYPKVPFLAVTARTTSLMMTLIIWTSTVTLSNGVAKLVFHSMIKKIKQFRSYWTTPMLGLISRLSGKGLLWSIWGRSLRNSKFMRINIRQVDRNFNKLSPKLKIHVRNCSPTANIYSSSTDRKEKSIRKSEMRGKFIAFMEVLAGLILKRPKSRASRYILISRWKLEIMPNLSQNPKFTSVTASSQIGHYWFAMVSV